MQPIVDQINQLESKFEPFSNEELKNQTKVFKDRLAKDENLDDILPEAFAVVREAAKRVLNQRHYDVQLMGGITIHRGQIAEMRTGEGKTLVATLPTYLNALEGKGVHVITVNDYLAKRDTVWMSQIYNSLGLTVGCVQHQSSFIYDPGFSGEEEVDGERDEEGSFKVQEKYLRPVSRKEAYQADITYGTNNEFGFDYLRDNMTQDASQMVQRDLHYTIIDEIDSILVDEARTPLIISAPAEESTDRYYQFARLIPRLKENEDYNVDEKMRAATLTDEGIVKIEKALGMGNIYTEGGIDLVHHLEQALKAHALFKRDRDYVVKEGEVMIVDEFTGRLMQGRRYSEGLHQAIEAKEGVEIRQESKTLATVTFQNYFRLYKKLSGMTGTAVTEAEEFDKIYNLEVLIIPTNKPMIRKDLPDRIYRNERGKFKALAVEIKQRHEKGQPVLVGTISIEKNELLAELLAHEGVPHEILNAKHHENEAQIIAQAGKPGAVTIATNMAGRGVDIVFGGNPPDKEDAKKVKEAGGLHIIGTERHESRRIDNQLRGRAGRQGDPGSSQFYISTEDDLMRIFGSDRMKRVMETLGVPEDMPIENKMISRSIEAAQGKVEGHNFDIRKHLVEYDDVMNKHREVVYKRRKEILFSENSKEKILEMVENEIEQVVLFHTSDEDEGQWNVEEIYEVVNTIFPIPNELRIKMDDLKQKAGSKKQDAEARTEVIEYLKGLAEKTYDELEQSINESLDNPEAMRQIEKMMTLRAIDTLWIDHLSAMDYLRTGIGLRGYGQRDPLVEYKKEGFRMFNELLNIIQKQIVYSIYKVGLAKEMVPGVMQRTDTTFSAPAKTMDKAQGQFGGYKQPSRGEGPAVPQKVRDASGKKVGRNDPCPCGSGKKFKKCHGE